jgi:predicted  nucleic acid-binding Zn-ribbon protein
MHTNPFTAAGYDLSNLERQIQQKADKHEIYSLRSDVDRLESALQSADSTSAGLRDRCERLEEDFRRLNEQFDMLRAVVEDDRRGEILAQGQFGVGA